MGTDGFEKSVFANVQVTPGLNPFYILYLTEFNSVLRRTPRI